MEGGTGAGASAIVDALREGDVEAVATGLIEASERDATAAVLSVLIAYFSIGSDLKPLLVEAVGLALARTLGDASTISVFCVSRFVFGESCSGWLQC